MTEIKIQVLPPGKALGYDETTYKTEKDKELHRQREARNRQEPHWTGRILPEARDE